MGSYMTSDNNRDIQNQKVAKLWGSSWQKLSPRQRQLVGDILQDVKIVSIAEHLEVEANKMPLPDFTNATRNDRANYFGDRTACELISTQVLAITWQSVLEKTTDALVEQSNLEQLQFIFQELDYQQIANNAINDISSIVRQPADLEAIATIETQIKQLNLLFNNYFRQSSVVKYCEISLYSDLNYLLEAAIERIQNLGLLGLGTFALLANLHLLLLQEQAKFNCKEWYKFNCNLNKYITYIKNTIPQVFKRSVGKIDKECTCIKYHLYFDDELEYQCRYSDGKNIYIFGDRSKRAGYECNKHRLKMFHSTVDMIMQTVVYPLRSTVKIWQKLAVQSSCFEM